MKRTAIKRSAPLQRRKRLRRGPSRRTLNRKLAETLYLRWLHSQPCIGTDAFPPGEYHGPWHIAMRDKHPGHVCAGRIEQSHARNIGSLPTGMGRKEDDFKSVPMCSGLHRQWEERSGWFAGWTKEQRRAWFIARIAECHLRFQQEGGVLVSD
jgi:hypothetical protein